MPDIRKFMSIIDEAGESSVTKTKELGNDLFGARIYLEVSIHKTVKELSKALVYVERKPRGNTCIAILRPDADNLSADLKQSWVLNESYSDEMGIAKCLESKIGTYANLASAVKVVKETLLTEQRDTMDERNYGRGKDGDRF